jgi:hypothetical protein
VAELLAVGRAEILPTRVIELEHGRAKVCRNRGVGGGRNFFQAHFAPWNLKDGDVLLAYAMLSMLSWGVRKRVRIAMWAE